jgi:hypothetical protein
VLPLGTRSPCPWSESDQLRSTPAHTTQLQDSTTGTPCTRTRIWEGPNHGISGSDTVIALQHLQGIAPHRVQGICGKESSRSNRSLSVSKRDPLLTNNDGLPDLGQRNICISWTTRNFL